MSEALGDSAAKAAFARIRAAMAVTDVSGTEKSVLLVLAVMANEASQAFPPIGGPNGLTAKCSLGERTVQRAIQALVDAKHISRLDRPGHGVVYTIHPRQSDTPATAAPPSERRPATETPTPATAAPKQPITTKPQKASPSSERRERKADAFPVPDGVDPQHWRDLLANRKSKRLSNTPTAYAGLMRELAKFSDDEWPPGRVVQFAAERGWGGIFDPRKHHENRNGNRSSYHSQSSSQHPGGRTGAAADRVFGSMG